MPLRLCSCGGADAGRKTNSGSAALLHEAAGAGNLPAIANGQLLPAAPTRPFAGRQLWRHPLHRAASTADATTVKVLLDNGADLQAKGAQNRSPLHCGCVSGNVGVVRVLIEAGADVNCKAAAGNTALIYACGSGSLPCVRVLIGAGADVNMKGETGRTPLHAASKGGFADVAEGAVGRPGAEADVKGTAGNTPLQLRRQWRPREGRPDPRRAGGEHEEPGRAGQQDARGASEGGHARSRGDVPGEGRVEFGYLNRRRFFILFFIFLNSPFLAFFLFLQFPIHYCTPTLFFFFLPLCFTLGFGF